MSLVSNAEWFARGAHAGQSRKYTGEPYVTHCFEVASMVRAVGGSDAMICAAILHDTVEDTQVGLGHIELYFDKEIASLVEMLTDVSTLEDGNRAARKKIDLEHLAKASPAAQTIKLADLISNTKSIVKHDPDFARVYLKEKEALLQVLDKGHHALWETAADLLQQSKAQLNME